MPRAAPVTIALFPSSVPIAASLAPERNINHTNAEAQMESGVRDACRRLQASLPIDRDEALIDIELDKPAPHRRDLLVEVKAVSVNPVDTKVRKRTDPKGGAPKVLGYDATGVVAAVGPAVTLFKAGDAVWYAGSSVRPGTNSEFHLVDERIVGRKPRTLDFAAAAALPLTSI